MDMNLSKFWQILKDREGWCTAVHGVAESDTTQLGNFLRIISMLDLVPSFLFPFLILAIWNICVVFGE